MWSVPAPCSEKGSGTRSVPAPCSGKGSGILFLHPTISASTTIFFLMLGEHSNAEKWSPTPLEKSDKSWSHFAVSVVVLSLTALFLLKVRCPNFYYPIQRPKNVEMVKVPILNTMKCTRKLSASQKLFSNFQTTGRTHWQIYKECPSWLKPHKMIFDTRGQTSIVLLHRIH